MSEVPDFRNCPSCPELKVKVDKIFEALLGEDGIGLKNGIVYEIKQLKGKNDVSSSWTGFLKPIAIAVISSALTALLTYALAIRFGV